MNKELMEGRILSEVLVAGKVNIFELARRIRIGAKEELHKEDAKLFMLTLREMLSERKLLMNFDNEVMVSTQGKSKFNGGVTK